MRHVSESMCSMLKLNRRVFSALFLSGSLTAGFCAGALAPSGSEYRVLPALPGDQVRAQLSFNSAGGYLVVQDNSIDGNGLGIRARKYYPDLSASRWTFQVNSEGKGDQQNAKVAMLKEGGGAFAWQSSTAQGDRAFVRFIDANDTFTSPDIAVSDSVVGNQTDPVLAELADGTVVVVWSEESRDGSMKGIFAQRFSGKGARLGTTFQVNQISALDQRVPAVAAMGNGSFVVAWVADEHRHSNSIDIYARVFSASGQPTASEFRLNTSERICANPVLVGLPNGFRAAWSGKSHQVRSDSDVQTIVAGPNIESWDILSRLFDGEGRGLGDEAIVNNTRKGDQFAPKIASSGNRQLIVWTSFGQDGADEGVFGRLLTLGGDFDGNEFLVNTRTISKQIFPAVASRGEQGFTVAWSSFVGGIASFDLFAQNYQLAPDTTLPQPVAPFVSSLSQNSICVSWPELVSQSVASYVVYVDDAPNTAAGSEGMITVSRGEWLPGSTHSVRLAYRTTDGRLSAQSESVTVKTWGADENGDGLPDDWQTLNWGKKANWPSPTADSDLDGASNLEEFMAGTDPTDPASVLRVGISSRQQGLYLEWSTQPGNYYQIQTTSDFQNWRNVATPRFAPSTTDSIPATELGHVQYYRVIRMR